MNEAEWIEATARGLRGGVMLRFHDRHCACTCERIRYLNSSGTSVNERSRLATSDTITDRDSGENRYLAVPVSRNTGTNTTLIDRVARTVGTRDLARSV